MEPLAVSDQTTPIDGFLGEARRQITICNSCRYCEGYCAVFPAMERLPLVGEGDLTYLANLCHDCRACYQACMYTPPHEFAVEIPQLMSAARQRTYDVYARPRRLARAFARGPVAVASLSLAGCALFLLLAALGGGFLEAIGVRRASRFYDVVPYGLLLVPMILIAGLVVGALTWGLRDLWRDSHGTDGPERRDWFVALREAAAMRWLRGGGDDCYYPDAERPSAARRAFHHATAYGFLLTGVATVLAAIYQDAFGKEPPFPVLHPVVLCGLIGGIGIVVGASGLLWLKARAAPLGSPRERVQGYAFIASLDLVAITGLLLLALRSSAAMGPMMIVHLGAVVGLFLTAPYGKFVHAVYRLAALARSAEERRIDAAAAAGKVGKA